jgi:TetR/AcrR family transcriptional regulator, mexJK operon transcriptional repressor
MIIDTVKRPRHRPVDEGKRTAILDAAREEFFAHGFTAASIETIAARSNVSKVTVYNRFGSKEMLFANVVERECQNMGVGLADLSSDAADLRQQLIDFGERAIDFLTLPHVIRFEKRIAAESERDPNIGELFLNSGPRKMRGKLTELIERAISNRAINACDSHIAVSHLFGMIIGFDIFMARFSADGPDREKLRRNVPLAVDRFLEAYGA